MDSYYLQSYSYFQLLLLSLSIIIGYWIFRPTESPYRDFPRVSRPLLPWPWANTAEQSLEQGYNKYIKPRGKPFVMRLWAKDHLVMPPKYFTDLQRADGAHISFLPNFNLTYDMQLGNGDLDNNIKPMIQALGKGLESQTAQLIPLIYKEIDFALKDVLGESNGSVTASSVAGTGPSDHLTEPKTFDSEKLFAKITHRVCCRILVGRTLSEDPSFISAISRFAFNSTRNIGLLSTLPLGPFRSWVAFLLSLGPRFHLRAAIAKLEHEVAARIQSPSSTQDGKAAPISVTQDGISLLLSQTSTPSPRHTSHALVHTIAHITPPLTRILTNTLQSILFSLPSTVLGSLRAEATPALTTILNPTPTSTSPTATFPLLDSFIRETLRVYPPHPTSCTRTVRNTPWTLSPSSQADKLVLPPGTRCTWPRLAIGTDAEHYDAPFEFRGSRFWELAKETGVWRIRGQGGNKYAADWVGKMNLGWGLGGWVCPGREVALGVVRGVIGGLIVGWEVERDWAAGPGKVKVWRREG